MVIDDQRFEFARYVAGQVETILGGTGLGGARYDPDEFALYVGDDWILYLHNLFRETAALPSGERDARVTRFVRAVLDSGAEASEWEQVRALLRPILRSVTYGLGAPEATEFLSRPAFPFIDELVAIDRPHSRSIVTRSEAAAWGVCADEIFARARRNLAMLGQPEPMEPHTVARFVDDGDSYFTSRLVGANWLAAFAVDGVRPVAFIPDVDTLIIAPDDPEILETLFGMAEQQYREATRPLSPQGYTLDAQGAVVPFDRAGPHPQLPVSRRAGSGLAISEYRAQAEWLQSLLDDDLDDEPLGLRPAYVATPMLHDGATGPATVTIWGKDVEYLLPESDYVAFCDMDSRGEPYVLFTVPFADVVDIVGLKSVPDLAPPRYEARQWPDDAMLSALGRAAVSLE
ncbi:hypothetical protein [Nocardia transvalensis]|uniref:hypothetical protein n=1 Tax=Nocardia transvalensis TaxID=37333 RepID=UPI00189594C6|nr:hypothetical protein [Nocardia transvalensis]MBF6327152.1 hypothetical protein [Nocardia transvalensis]